MAVPHAKESERMESSPEGLTYVYRCTCGEEIDSGLRRLESDAKAGASTAFGLHLRGA